MLYTAYKIYDVFQILTSLNFFNEEASFTSLLLRTMQTQNGHEKNQSQETLHKHLKPSNRVHGIQMATTSPPASNFLHSPLNFLLNFPAVSNIRMN